MASNFILEGKFISFVPIAVYRELATELKLTQAQLNFYRTRYEQAHRQNQQLIQERREGMTNSKIYLNASAPTAKTVPLIPTPAQILDSPTETEVKFHWLVIIMVIILVSSFGLGFVIMNSLSAQKSRRA